MLSVYRAGEAGADWCKGRNHGSMTWRGARRWCRREWTGIATRIADVVRLLFPTLPSAQGPRADHGGAVEVETAARRGAAGSDRRRARWSGGGRRRVRSSAGTGGGVAGRASSDLAGGGVNG
jgi:hypothetical protein